MKITPFSVFLLLLYISFKQDCPFLHSEKSESCHSENIKLQFVKGSDFKIVPPTDSKVVVVTTVKHSRNVTLGPHTPHVKSPQFHTAALRKNQNILEYSSLEYVIVTP